MREPQLSVDDALYDDGRPAEAVEALAMAVGGSSAVAGSTGRYLISVWTLSMAKSAALRLAGPLR
jgi:hypothetical protein